MARPEQTHLTSVIDPTPPFDFALSSYIFSDGDPRIARYHDGAYRQVLRAGNTLMLATVTSTGSVETPQMRVTLASDRSLSDRNVAAALEIIRSIFNVSFDVTKFYLATHDDPIIVRLTQQLRGLKNPVTATVFEALFDSIVEQQISLNVAHILERRVIMTFGDVLRVDGKEYFAFPTPEQLAVLSSDSLRRCGLSVRKAEYITGVAQGIAAREVDLEKLRRCSDVHEILDRLCALRGVGVWTAELTALRGLSRLDVIPADDLGLRRWIAHYYCDNRLITSKQAREVAKRWGKWKGLAAYYLIIAGLLKIT